MSQLVPLPLVSASDPLCTDDDDDTPNPDYDADSRESAENVQYDSDDREFVALTCNPDHEAEPLFSSSRAVWRGQ